MSEAISVVAPLSVPESGANLVVGRYTLSHPTYLSASALSPGDLDLSQVHSDPQGV